MGTVPYFQGVFRVKSLVAIGTTPWVFGVQGTEGSWKYRGWIILSRSL